ncbi:hypothetical protein AK88_02518 [Plasmodium fragile]|uniref:Uncharacterized protein n=1 Tax=Plasmodium fragile TaxID=5857 RepID=A0A0D9QLV4_PLAFR|nr:uncharacterized protein AK88_02518 [Plasmodium fragile]KJP87762.1 hypothetical protein AK88_02518 [Plasmodium fragile]
MRNKAKKQKRSPRKGHWRVALICKHLNQIKHARVPQEILPRKKRRLRSLRKQKYLENRKYLRSKKRQGNGKYAGN